MEFYGRRETLCQQETQNARSHLVHAETHAEPRKISPRPYDTVMEQNETLWGRALNRGREPSKATPSPGLRWSLEMVECDTFVGSPDLDQRFPRVSAEYACRSCPGLGRPRTCRGTEVARVFPANECGQSACRDKLSVWSDGLILAPD
jgi:hypothetical protein